MNPSVRATVSDLSGRRFDVLVIGGGATGAGIAREAALRGLTALVVDRSDFASGTSSRSSRLIHGGLRYLEQRDWTLVRESLAERRILLRTAPHLVWPLAFLFPLFTTDRVGRWTLELGLTVYDLLALRGNVRRHRSLSKRGVLDHEPGLRDRGLTGGSLYWDAQCDDARLVLATIRSAARHGALAANYVSVIALDLDRGRVSGVLLEDQLTGTRARVEAGVVVNATGPWTDRIRQLEDPDAAPLVHPTRGAHVMVPRARIGHRHAITFLSPIDGRVMFVLPWGDRSYIGTTDRECATGPDQVAATEEDVEYLLGSANAIFPNARLGPGDVSLSWAALRPLLVPAGPIDPSQRSREHAILLGPAGMLTVAGGKLTTFRRMAVEVVDRITAGLGTGSPADPEGGRSATEPLVGGEPHPVQELRDEGVRRGLPEAMTARLVQRYGSETGAIFQLVEQCPELGRPIHPAHPAIGAQVIHAVRFEYARRLDDVMYRRLGLPYETPDNGLSGASTVATLMARELEWDEGRCRLEMERYRTIVDAIPPRRERG